MHETPLESVPAIVAAILPSIVGATDLPYALFGHSLGALVAFEVVRCLEATGARAPDHLFVSARRAPTAVDPRPPVAALPDADFLRVIEARYGALPAAIRDTPDLLEIILPALRADLRAAEQFAPVPSGVTVGCPITVYGGQDDLHPRPDELGGWQALSRGRCGIRIFAGGHFYLHETVVGLTRDIASRWPG